MSGLDAIYDDRTRAVIVSEAGEWSAVGDCSSRVVLAGSFNPLHEGHRRLAGAASRISGRVSLFEISIENVDKPDLPREELEQRLTQFADYADIAVTRAPLFSDKAALLPGAWFVIGYDTAVRLIDDRYNTDGDATADLQQMSDRGVKFLVAGRVDADQVFRGLDDLEAPDQVSEMFIAIPEDEFRADVSSTELRAQRSR